MVSCEEDTIGMLSPVFFIKKRKLALNSFRIIKKFSIYIISNQYLRSSLSIEKNCSTNMATLETLSFDNLVLRTLPVDSNTENYVRQVANACFSRVKPTPVENPKTVCYSSGAMALLDLPENELQHPDFSLYFSGNKLLPGSDPASHCYCGHQFGQFAGQLGDGAAIYLGEIVNKNKERWEIQLKGAGKTPYSRQADGRKVLRSSIREFLCSEAMHYLGIPTTRAGACITSDTPVIRDIFYDGHPLTERASIVLRIAPTFIRFGSFEIFKTRDELTGRVGPSVGRVEILKQLLEYVIGTFYPEIDKAFPDDTISRYKSFFHEVVVRTAHLVAEWQCVGFCHGVLNTDNMSIIGLTIDYGPFGFIDRFNPDHICNASDEGGRYTYKRQPEICLWNLRKLAEVLQHYLPSEESSEELKIFNIEYKKYYLEKMRKKFGLLKVQLPEDEKLIQNFFDVMEETGADFTNSFRGLSILSLPKSSNHEESKELLIEYLLKQSSSQDELKKAYSQGMDERQFQMYVMLLNTQPEILQLLGKGVIAIERELERRKKLQKLQEMLPGEKERHDRKKWEEWIGHYVQRLQKEIKDLSNIEPFNAERKAVMNGNNPRVVLRNYIVQNAIIKAESGDFTEVQKLMSILVHPYDDPAPDEILDLERPTTSSPEEDDSAEAAARSSDTVPKKSHEQICTYDSRPPDWALGLRVT